MQRQHAPQVERRGGAGPLRQGLARLRQWRAAGSDNPRQRTLRQRPGASPALHPPVLGKGKRGIGAARAANNRESGALATYPSPEGEGLGGLQPPSLRTPMRSIGYGESAGVG